MFSLLESRLAFLFSVFSFLPLFYTIKLHLNMTMRKQWKQCQTLFLGAPKSLQMVSAAMKLKDAYSLVGKL